MDRRQANRLTLGILLLGASVLVILLLLPAFLSHQSLAGMREKNRRDCVISLRMLGDLVRDHVLETGTLPGASGAPGDAVDPRRFHDDLVEQLGASSIDGWLSVAEGAFVDPWGRRLIMRMLPDMVGNGVLPPAEGRFLWRLEIRSLGPNGRQDSGDSDDIACVVSRVETPGGQSAVRLTPGIGVGSWWNE